MDRLGELVPVDDDIIGRGRETGEPFGIRRRHPVDPRLGRYRARRR